MAVNPQDLAEEQTQRAQINAAGSPTEFATDPAQGVQVAGKGSAVMELFAPVIKIIDSVDSSVSKPSAASGLGTKQSPVGVAPRVPTGQERGLIDEPGMYSEAATKRELAPKILSAEGVEKFKDRNLQSFGIGEEAPTDVLKDAQSALSDQSKSASALAIDVNKQAQRALQADKRGFSAEAGVIDETVADEILLRTSQKEQNIQSLKDGGDFNFDYVDTDDDVKAMITAVGETYADETVARTRGKIPNNKTKQDAMLLLADEIGFTDRLLSRRIGEGGLTADEFVAGRELLVRSAEKLENLAIQIKNGAGADVRLKFRRQLAIHSGIQLQLKGAQTEAARALQSFQISVSGELNAEQFSAEANRLLKESGQDDVTEMMADRLLRAGKENGMKGINEFSQAGYYAKTKQMVHEAFLAGLLSAPSTQFKNIFSNASFMLFQLPTEIFAGMFGEVVRAGRKQLGMAYPIAEDQIYIEDAMLRVKGWSDAWGDAMKAASIAWRTEQPAGASKLDIDQYQPSFQNSETMFGKSLDTLSKSMRIPFRLLLAGDEFTKTISQRGEFYTALNKRYQHSLRQGMTKEEAMDEAGMLMLDPRAVADDLDVKAKFDTLQSDLGAFGKAMSAFQRKLVGRFIVPFVTAPTNALLRTLEYIPLPVSKAAFDLLGHNGPRKQQLAFGRFTMGTATTLAVGKHAMDGNLTGGMPETKVQREALPPGWQPYSFVLKGEGWPEGVDDLFDVFGRPNGPLRYVSYSGYEPVGGLLAIIADTVQRANKTRDPELQKSYIHAAAIAVGEYYKEAPMLQGIADVTSFLNGFDPAKIARSYAENATPVGLPNPLSSLQRMFQRLADPTPVSPREDFEYYTLEDIQQFDVVDGNKVFKYAKTNGSPNYDLVGTPKKGWGVQAFFDKMNSFQAKDSFVRDERDYNAVRYDTFGEVQGEEDVSFANKPGAAIFGALTGLRIKDGDALENYEKELIRLHDMTNKWPLTNPEKYNNITLSYGTQSDLIRLAKNEVKVRRSGFGTLTFRQTLSAVTQSRSYKGLKDKDRIALLRNINKQFIDQGFRVLIQVPGNEDLKTAYQQVERLKKEGRR